MVRGSSTPRPYRSPLRQQQAEATRVAIRASAARLFERDGYARTTISAIADEAGVSPESVYAAFGNKRSLLGAVFEHAAAGTDPAPEVVDEAWVEALQAEPDARQRLRLMSERTRGMLDRSAALNEMVRFAARTDPGLAVLEAELDARRLADVERLVRVLAEAGPLRLSEAEAVDVVWAIAVSDLYLRVRRSRGWSSARADDLIEDLIARVLLP